MIKNSNDGGGAKAKKKPKSALSMLAGTMADVAMGPVKTVDRAVNNMAGTVGRVNRFAGKSAAGIVGTAKRVGKIAGYVNPFD